VARTMLLSVRTAGCRTGLVESDSRPRRSTTMRRTAKRVERRDWRREIEAEYGV
jgi:hypothetical protein